MRKDEGKTKEQLLNELEEMRQRIKELKASEAERKRVGHDLAERVKELRCLYSIASIAERPHVTLDELYQEVANLLPDAWQYPEITGARVVINNKRFETENWRETEWKQSYDVKVHGVKAGAVEVCYLEEKPPIGEGPFLIEERHLIDAVAERLGRITERKRAEEALAESKERHETILENTHAVIFQLSPLGIIQYVSPKVEYVYSYKPEDLVGKHFKKTTPVSELPKALKVFKSVLSGKTISNLEIDQMDANGKIVTMEINANPVRRDGKIIAVQGVMRDITEQKQLEEARVEQAVAQARAEEVQQSRQRIMAMQESLRRDIAQQIHGTVQNRLIILMHRLADIERSSPSEQIAVEVADLRQKLEELVEDHIRPISHRLFPSIMRRGLVPALQSLADQFETAKSIDMELSEELKRQERTNPRFITERVRLAAYRIVEEALGNATKHAKASRITVKLELSSKGWLRLTVQDDGRGFDMESAVAGLGTLMMQDYAEVAGGSCVINSTPGKGTEVTAVVPLAEPGAEYPERA